ncbi:MAG: hypothetical protein LBP87_12855 [Planctomycetaceae bacterium]|jgi:hypothetical protein|nr:hypothetical protein [Planctomycetaceae bacterium]
MNKIEKIDCKAEFVYLDITSFQELDNSPMQFWGVLSWKSDGRIGIYYGLGYREDREDLIAAAIELLPENVTVMFNGYYFQYFDWKEFHKVYWARLDEEYKVLSDIFTRFDKHVDNVEYEVIHKEWLDALCKFHPYLKEKLNHEPKS